MKKKFVIGSGSKVVSVCYFDKENNWWVSKVIKKNKPHKSTILSCAWNPTDNLIMATGCADDKARCFSTWIKNVDPKEQKSEFAIVKGEWGSKGWIHDIQFSPNGKILAFVGHDSCLTIVDVASGNANVVKTNLQPFKKLLFLSDKAIVTAGHDFTPVVFSSQDGTTWKLNGKCEGETSSSTTKRTFGTKEQNTQETTSAPTTRHKNLITCLYPYKLNNGIVTDFCTSSLDGRLLFWKVSEIEKTVSGFKC